MAEEYAATPIIFVGHVLSQQSVAESPSSGLYEDTGYTVRVDEALRGTPHGRIRLFTENSSDRFPMAVGKKYVLFVYQQQGRLMVDNCGNSGLLSERTETLAGIRRLRELNQRRAKHGASSDHPSRPPESN
ncbi:MAG TPA: hypothetical protein VGK30_13385 [Candidatus Binatia bacterium]